MTFLIGNEAKRRLSTDNGFFGSMGNRRTPASTGIFIPQLHLCNMPLFTAMPLAHPPFWPSLELMYGQKAAAFCTIPLLFWNMFHSSKQLLALLYAGRLINFHRNKFRNHL
jgi:hypothetical protein